jgi:hypothetical protein
LADTGTDAALVRREASLSALINAGFSALFFFAVFGLSRPVTLADFGPDFLPQTFMVTLLASIVPGLVLAKRLGRPRAGKVVLRSIVVAVGATVLLGGGAWLLCLAAGPGELPAGVALSIKVLFGAALGAVATVASVRYTLAAAAQGG